MELHIVVCAGLANRLRAFLSACCWAQHIHCRLRVTWPVGNMECNAKFQDLFTQTALPPWIRIDIGPVLTKPILIKTEDDMKIYLATGGKGPVESYSRFWNASCDHWTQSLLFLKPHPILHPHSGVKEDWFGIHIRRGDHTLARQHSPLTLFIPVIRSHLEENHHVFVCSDDASTLQEIQKNFGVSSKLHISEGWKGGRGTRQGIQNAVRDIWTLAQCGQGICSSFQSSFGECASWLYGVPFRIVHNA